MKRRTSCDLMNFYMITCHNDLNILWKHLPAHLDPTDSTTCSLGGEKKNNRAGTNYSLSLAQVHYPLTIEYHFYKKEAGPQMA